MLEILINKITMICIGSEQCLFVLDVRRNGLLINSAQEIEFVGLVGHYIGGLIEVKSGPIKNLQGL